MTSETLRVSIYPIPDLAGDKLDSLKEYIKSEFKKECPGAMIQVETSADIYNAEKMTSTYLGPGEKAYDVMEVDTILLGEVVGCLQPLDDYFTITKKEYSESAVRSVTFDKKLYGIPTLQCANFLMELADPDRGPQKPLLRDWTSFGQLKEALDEAIDEDSCHKPFMVGDFTGSWGLPMFYLDAYVDEHGEKSVYEGIDAPVNDETLIENLKHFTDYGALSSGKNPDTDGTFHKDHDRLIDEVTDSDHILMYAYSESLGEALQRSAQKKKAKSALNIVSPPLDKSNFLLTYTDAVVVNKSKFADTKRAELIVKFVKFYTSLKFRENVAFGRDLPASVTRYVLPARNDFFTETKAADDKYYKMFRDALTHSVAAPNHGVYHKRKALQAKLEKALDFPK